MRRLVRHSHERAGRPGKALTFPTTLETGAVQTTLCWATPDRPGMLGALLGFLRQAGKKQKLGTTKDETFCRLGVVGCVVWCLGGNGPCGRTGGM